MNIFKKWYNNFIKDMEKANKESFGDKKLDCCGLNDNKKKKVKSNSTYTTNGSQKILSLS